MPRSGYAIQKIFLQKVKYGGLVPWVFFEGAESPQGVTEIQNISETRDDGFGIQPGTDKYQC